MSMIKRIKQFSDEHHLLCKILVFVFSAGLMMLLSYHWTGSLVYYNGDSKMYISIADNFLDNGHFLQTVRTERENFIVPFGFPAILTVLRLFTRNDLFIALVQYAVFGLSCTLLYCAERNFFGNIGGLSVIAHCLMIWRIHYAGPGCIVTETWYIAIIIFCVWLLSRRDMAVNSRLTLAYAALLVGFIIRPLLGVLFFPLAAYLIVRAVRGKYNAGYLALMISVSALILGAIGMLNYRETGHFVITEAYSGISVYLINNDNVTEWGIDFAKGEYEYADERFWSIYNRTDIDYYDKNELLSDIGYQYMLRHPFVTLKNIVVKFTYMFITYWYGVTAVAAAGAVAAFRQRKLFRAEYAIMIAAAGVIAVITSFGIPEPRYCYAIFPVITLFVSALAGYCVHHAIPSAVENLKAGRQQDNV